MIKGEVLKYIVVGKRRNSCIIPGETSIPVDPQTFSEYWDTRGMKTLLKIKYNTLLADNGSQVQQEKQGSP